MSRTLIFAILGLVLLPSVAAAQEEKKAWWNPLGLIPSSSNTRSSDFFNAPKKESDTFLGMPKPEWMKGKSKQKKSSSGMKSFTQSSKKFWANTADFMNPFDKKEAPKDYLGANVGFQTQAESEKPSSGGFGWLWPKAPEPEQPQTINDWLGQKNPLSQSGSVK